VLAGVVQPYGGAGITLAIMAMPPSLGSTQLTDSFQASTAAGAVIWGTRGSWYTCKFLSGAKSLLRLVRNAKKRLLVSLTM